MNISDYHQLAKEKLSGPTYGYYSAGSDDMITRDNNESSFKKIKLLPRVLVDTSNCDTTTSILGGKIKMDCPILVAPTAMHKLAHPEGELATATASKELGIPFISSELATTSLEDIASVGGMRMMQMYFFDDREFTLSIIRRAEQAGYQALVVTVDAAVIGNRETDRKDQLFLPEGVSLSNVTSILESKFADISWVSALTQYLSLGISKSVTWKDIQWLREQTKLPIILKGILHPEDALTAYFMGADAIIVSNHGGRQCDTTVSTIDALPDIISTLRSANSDMEVYIDGGIRRGTDILKCIAMGAKAVLVGRPIIWGLAVNGKEGVKDVLSILKSEFEVAMKLCGYRDLCSLQQAKDLLK